MTIGKLFSRVLVRQRDYGKGRICSRDDQCPHQSYCNNLEGTCKCKSDLIGDGRTCKLGKFYKLTGSINTGARNQERAIPIPLGRLCPEVQSLPFRYHFWQKRNPQCLLLTNGTPFTYLVQNLRTQLCVSQLREIGHEDNAGRDHLCI